MSQQKQKRQNSQPSTERMQLGIDIVETRRRVDELRVNIINHIGKNMEAPVIIIQNWLKKDEEEAKK